MLVISDASLGTIKLNNETNRKHVRVSVVDGQSGGIKSLEALLTDQSAPRQYNRENFYKFYVKRMLLILLVSETVMSKILDAKNVVPQNRNRN